MKLTQFTQAYGLTLDETLARLAASPVIDGLALFGSRPSGATDAVSDFDVLVLVNSLPAPIFQLLAWVDGRLADVIFVETEMVDRVGASSAPVAADSFEGLFLLKMHRAEIVYDAEGRLARVQAWVRADAALAARLEPSPYAARYAAWFWQNHALLHLERLVQSSDPVHLTTFDLMLAACLGDYGRSYMATRAIPWQGQTVFVRYLTAHDEPVLAMLRECLAEADRRRKVALYADLVEAALRPFAPRWAAGETAVYLMDPARHATDVEATLAFWESLLAVA